MNKKRGRKNVELVPINKRRFMQALAYNGFTIKSLGASHDISISESSIGKYLRRGGFPKTKLEEVSEFLNVEPAFIKGEYDIKGVDDPEVFRILDSHIRPEKHPYIRKAAEDITLEEYYRVILEKHEVPFSVFKEMPAPERLSLQHEIEDALVPVLLRHFDKQYHEKICMLDVVVIDDLQEYYEWFGLDWLEKGFESALKAAHEELDKCIAEELANAPENIDGEDELDRKYSSYNLVE